MATGNLNGSPNTQFFDTDEERLAWVAAQGANFDDGGQYQGAVYVQLNKEYLQAWLNQATQSQITIPSSDPTAQLQNVGSPKAIWNSDNKNFHSLSDESASGAPNKPRKQTERTRVPEIVLTNIRVELAVAYTIARQQRQFAFASKILSIIDQLDSGRITAAEATKLYTALLASI